jgi:hypothetical protein
MASAAGFRTIQAVTCVLAVYGPKAAVRFEAERCSAASPDRTFVHHAALSEGEGRQSATKQYSAVAAPGSAFEEPIGLEKVVRADICGRGHKDDSYQELGRAEPEIATSVLELKTRYQALSRQPA